ncbi:hypothetical protein [Demequina lutea]|uniref:Short C-terminal domain-containing protein n=1 Tax=Demequina lutea TaxID=431489 RepID=A0A7Y9ZE62_9MICO|nr:hypothetical protein [Demequina lutea]NYI42593.1 hypothetical protein [Demequina lutea]
MAHEEQFPGQAPESTDQAHVQEIEDQVRDLAKIRDEGLLTYEEFAAKKAALLAEL